MKYFLPEYREYWPTIFHAIDTGHVHEAIACRAYSILRFLLPGALPLEIVGGRYRAAALGHAIPEHRLFFGGFAPGIDDPFPIGKGISPGHSKCGRNHGPTIRYDRHGIRGEYLSGCFDLIRIRVPVYLVNDLT